MDTQVTVVGNLVADPRLATTSTGHLVTSFRIASTPRRFDRGSGEWRDGETLYANVTCWRGLAENVASSLHKGQSAIVVGRLSVRPYETKDGEKRQSVDIDAIAVGPDLSRTMTMAVKRAERVSAAASPSDEPADSWGAPEAPASDAHSVDEFAGELDDLEADINDAALVDGRTGERLDERAGEGAGEAFDNAVGGESGAASSGSVAASATEAGEPVLAGAGGRRKPRFGIG